MEHRTSVIGLALSLFALGCADSSRPTSPRAPAESASLEAMGAAAGSLDRIVSMMDACDPTSFNAALGAGTCSRTGGGITFDRFLSQLEANGSVGAWHFAPTEMNVSVGQTLVAMNRGGEAHTFTEVEHFGGGFVPSLNQLSGNPVPAAECLQLSGSDFVIPGAAARDLVKDEGTELYQCCIHPWMRVTVHAKHGS